MRRFPNLMSMSAMSGLIGPAGPNAKRLSPLADFGHNPGQLDAKIYVPEGLAANAALVVVLHGCTQTADQYDHGSGWSAVAEEYGFAVLYPEQERANNPNLCFNWFLPQDSRRDRGEALSIRNMIVAAVETHQLDPRRIFITGLSAGGAMANVMLATYPEVFAGGAIIAGLPYGTATDVPQALERMRGQGLPSDRKLVDLVHRATDYQGPWPTISVWHGSADATVYPSNADAIVAQWRNVHGLAAEPTRREKVGGYPRQIWCDPRGRECVESFTINGMAHGTPVATQGSDACGSAGPYMLDKQISSTRHICRFWALTDPAATRAVDHQQTRQVEGNLVTSSSDEGTDGLGGATDRLRTSASISSPSTRVGKVIEDALRAAGLVR